MGSTIPSVESEILHQPGITLKILLAKSQITPVRRVYWTTQELIDAPIEQNPGLSVQLNASEKKTLRLS